MAETFRNVSFTPTLTKQTIGGSGESTVVYEWGARFGIPSGLMLETQAIGRGTIVLLRRWYIPP